jgi:ketosteroid isomerase-like protein
VALIAAALTLASSARAQSASDESLIRKARAASNAAIAAHDVDGTVRVMHPDFVSVSSTNIRNLSRDAAKANYEQIFRTRTGVVFVRTPTAITVNKRWRQAGESGRWTGKWSTSDGNVRVGGIYFAKWIGTNGEWRLLAETFVQTSCVAKTFCNAPPG